MKVKSLIVPYLIEPNGKVKKFLEVARDPRVKKEYKELVKELGARPETLGKKLRAATWSGKSLDDIVRELEHEKGR